ncbi:transcriptional regulator TAC1-like [Punica granatum]|uniref:C2H2-type domain-containing protein n=2 Tax=Punica granatum TaxID=22663 RepID=A0A218W5K0_PUNGR|nr:transcriptional regulator TAC1-like [Punica granatum]OWM68137.1 hypothetical protein CDL15_Pgr016337 [Punica granatum]PKI73738.1 hypothetical protein CRG98_005865 [Punica granatum]
MESRRHDLSEASSDENDPSFKCADETTVLGMSKRSYECVFCKQGFTNAQALGGHMNIHRKDRARAKQVVAGPSAQPPKHYPIWESPRGYGYPCDDSSYVSGLGFNHQPSADENYFNYQDMPRAGYSGQTNDEVSYANLSLRIELSQVEEMRSTTRGENDEIDLELRLGQYGRSCES